MDSQWQVITKKKKHTKTKTQKTYRYIYIACTCTKGKYTHIYMYTNEYTCNQMEYWNERKKNIMMHTFHGIKYNV